MRIFDEIENKIYDNFDKNILCRLYVRTISIPDYFQYLFAKADNPGFSSSNKFEDWWERLKCRIKHHPCGSIYYNPGGYEPDGRCKNCGDEIG